MPGAILPALAAAEAFPAPGPWDARAIAGAALYGALFLAALWGAWRLARGALPEEDAR